MNRFPDPRETDGPQASPSVTDPAAYSPPGHFPGGYPAGYPDDEIDLLELFKVLWDGKWWVFLITFLAGAGGVGYALSQSHYYSAEAVLAPARSDAGGGASSALAGLGGLASLAGVRVGGGGGEVPIALETMRSRQFLIEFIHRHELLPALFAFESWDPKTLTWSMDTERYDPVTGTWISDTEPAQPTDWEAYRRFSGMLEVQQGRDNPFVRVNITHASPVLAQQWLVLLIEDINEHMRTAAISKAEQTIAYLQGQIERTQAAGMQQMLYQLMEEEMKTLMLSNLNEGYIFQMIDPPMIPERPSGPQRKLIAMIATLLGGMLGLGFVLVRHWVRSSREAKAAP